MIHTDFNIALFLFIAFMLVFAVGVAAQMRNIWREKERRDKALDEWHSLLPGVDAPPFGSKLPL